jgi:NAD(P)-dependent dehydrogenase (short-subunit alcohol dehydrogenase family)
MDLELSGKHAVVTGVSSGIGAAVVEALAGEGCRVSFCGRRAAPIAQHEGALATRRRPGDGAVAGTAIDVTDQAALLDWLDQVAPFDILIANVSAMSEQWPAALATDITATVALIEAALPRMVRGGAITYVGSKVSGYATPGYEAYGAVKAAVTHYIKSVAARLPDTGIRANVVAPGDTFCPGGWWDRVPPEMLEATIRANPLGRLAEAAEIARVIAFISSPAASFVSGATWYVDGGATPQVQY